MYDLQFISDLCNITLTHNIDLTSTAKAIAYKRPQGASYSLHRVFDSRAVTAVPSRDLLRADLLV